MKTLTFRFELSKGDGGEFSVRLTGEGFEPVSAPFRFEVRPGSQIEDKLALIDENACAYDDINYAGRQLWLGLMAGRLEEIFRQQWLGREKGARIHLRLALPAEPLTAEVPIDIRALPWESLYNPEIGSLAGDPDFCLIREPPLEARIGTLPPTAGRRLAMLVIIPANSGLNTDHELSNLEREGARLTPEIQLERLVGLVTPDRLQQTIARQEWDIVHFVGHGNADERGRVTVLLNDEGGGDHWMDGEIFARCFAGRNIRLAVLNCCYGDKPLPSRSLSGLGPYLMRVGIPAVVAMRYEIADAVAINFSKTFYSTLFSGDQRGRVDVALETARNALLLNQRPGAERGFITPVLYLAQGHEALFEIAATPDSRTVAEVRMPVGQLPEDLVAAFRERQCVPVLGPVILSMGVLRRGNPLASQTVGPRDFAGELARVQECPYPQTTTDFQLGAVAGEWMNGHLLQWVCQHFQHMRKGRAEMLKRLNQAYGALEPAEPLEKIARWPVPAMFYTYFDGLLERCVTLGNSSLNGLITDLRAPAADCRPAVEQRPFVLLRGSLSDPDSLVLTEEDFDGLLESLHLMNSAIASLARQTGRSVLFLGVSPRDPLVRAVAQKLVESGSRRKQGPTFFVWPGRTEVDEAYWSRYAVQWIDDTPEEVICALNAL